MSFLPRTTIATAALPGAAPAGWLRPSVVRLARRVGLGSASVASGAVLGLGCSGVMPWWVSAIALAGLAWCVRHALALGRRGRSGLHFALGALAMQLAGGWWLGLGVNPRGDALPWQILVVSMTVGLQVAWLVGAWRLAILATAAWPERSFRVGQSLAWCLAWGAAEALRELGPTGYAYTTLGTAFMDLRALSGWAPVLGVHGLSMLVAWMAWLVAGSVSPRPSGGRTAGARAACLATLAVAGGGQLLSGVAWTQPDGASIAVTLVQDASDKRQVWREAERDLAEDRLLDAIRSTPDGGMVVTPEGYFAEPLPIRPEWFWQTLRGEAQARGVHVLVGMPQRALDNGERLVLNAILQFAPDRFAIYAKERLVPGGESLPMASVFSALYDGAFQSRVDAHRVGESAAPRALTQPLFAAGAFVGASICHELSFTTTMAERARGSAWLLNAADDAWIPSAAYRLQMAVIARTRALELAKPLLRVTDGGASMLVGADGRIEQLAPETTAALLHWRVQPRVGATPYERHANALTLAPAAALGILSVVALALRVRRPFQPDQRTP